MVIKQLSVFLENKKGRLAAVMNVLAKHNVDVSALSLADTTEFGVLRLIVDKTDEAKQALTEHGVVVRGIYVYHFLGHCCLAVAKHGVGLAD